MRNPIILDGAVSGNLSNRTTSALYTTNHRRHDDIRKDGPRCTNAPLRPCRIRVNGADHDVTAAPDTPLLYVLRNDLGLTGPKFGCGLGQCGACMVHIDGAPRRSCTTPSPPPPAEVTTIEGLGTPEKPHPVQQAFIDEQAAQCGYCINGMIMAPRRSSRATHGRRARRSARR